MEVFDHISEDLAAFIAEQPMFFVATAPLSGGHVNLSPKGLDTLRVIGPTMVAYLDLTGSGNETSSHLAENGRLTLMLCSFGARTMILRLYGRGRTVLPDDHAYGLLRPHFGDIVGERQIIVLDVERVQTSCGYAVPRMDNPRQRDTLVRWAEKKGDEGLKNYRAEKNALSIDGLPAPIGRTRSTD
ncbi:MAG TPA: pyridoxamine 5'-phosphate oxidase family protein [Candidatus Limnocylindrales bacterium]|nr:pyridoxamine 5'-phosphate oxidase family protein [Candidatus Limnocylindrales bacterium]